MTKQTMIAVPCPGVPGPNGEPRTTYRFVLVSGCTAGTADQLPASRADATVPGTGPADAKP